jgi:hypothetical protein
MRPYNFILTLLLFGTLLSPLGCRTTNGEKSAESSKSLPSNTPGATESKHTYKLSRDQSQAIYLAMLKVELASGIKVAKDKLHSSKGIIQCHRDGIIESCFFRVRVMGDELSSTQPLSKELAKKVWEYIRDSRADLVKEKVALTNLVCDYIGKKSPPFNQEMTKCQLEFPRSMAEAIFVDRTAEELAEALRGELAFTNTKVTLNGTIACQWISQSSRTPCVARRIEKGVLKENIIELPQNISNPIARQLKQTVGDHQKLKNPSKNFASPKEINGSLSCVVDSLNFKSTNTRRYVCRVKI